MNKTEAHIPPTYSIRMPTEMRQQLEVFAKEGGRSLHAEILLRLDESIRASINKLKNEFNGNINDLSNFEGLTEAQRQEVLEIVRAEFERLAK